MGINVKLISLINQRVSRSSIFLLLAILATYGQISGDIYIPSLPSIASTLSISHSQAQLTMASFMLGLVVMTLVYGPLSEGIGRQYALVLGLSVSLIGNIVCAFSHHIFQLQVGRFVQGAGTASTAVLWRSIFRDQFRGRDLSRFGGYILYCVVLTTMIAPVIGGYVDMWFSWHEIFYLLMLWTIIVIGILIFYSDSNTSVHYQNLSRDFLMYALYALWQDKQFLKLSMTAALVNGCFFVWLTIGSTLLIHHVGVTPAQFGHWMLWVGLSMTMSGIVNSKLLKWLAPVQIVQLALSVVIFSGLLMVILFYSVGFTAPAVVLPIMIFIFAMTLAFINCFAVAFEKVGHVAGYAGSMYTFIQQVGGLVMATIASYLNQTTPMPMAIIFLILGVFGFLLVSSCG